MKLSIIIPVYNEEQTIRLILDKVNQVRLPDSIKKEVIVVDDGSKDNSKFIIQNLRINGLIKIYHKKNLGKGAAIRSGLNSATGDLVIIQDADLEYNPADYERLLRPILTDKAEVVYGSRLINYPLKSWGRNKTVVPLHLIANKGLTGFTNFLYGSNLTDMETCYKLFKKEVLQKISLKSNRFEFEPEITVKILKLKIPIVEIPINVKPRTYEEGKKIGLLDGFLAIWILIKYKFS